MIVVVLLFCRLMSSVSIKQETTSAPPPPLPLPSTANGGVNSPATRRLPFVVPPYITTWHGYRAIKSAKDEQPPAANPKPEPDSKVVNPPPTPDAAHIPGTKRPKNKKKRWNEAKQAAATSERYSLTETGAHYASVYEDGSQERYGSDLKQTLWFLLKAYRAAEQGLTLKELRSAMSATLATVNETQRRPGAKRQRGRMIRQVSRNMQAAVFQKLVTVVADETAVKPQVSEDEPKQKKQKTEDVK